MLDCRTFRQVVYTAVSTQRCGTALEFVRVSEKGYVSWHSVRDCGWRGHQDVVFMTDLSLNSLWSISYQLQIDGFCRSWCPWKLPDFVSWWFLWDCYLSVQWVPSFVADFMLISKTSSLDSIYKKVALKRLNDISFISLQRFLLKFITTSCSHRSQQVVQHCELEAEGYPKSKSSVSIVDLLFFPLQRETGWPRKQKDAVKWFVLAFWNTPKNSTFDEVVWNFHVDLMQRASTKLRLHITGWK